MTNLQLVDFFESLDRWGVTDVLLPFLLVFTLVFAVLEKTKILGADKKNFNVIVGLVMAAAVVMPHVTSSYASLLGFDPVDIINKALPSVSILVVAIMMLLILIGVFAHDKVMLGLTMPGWIGLGSILAIIFIFGSSAGWWGGDVPSALEQFFGQDAIAVVIMILIFGIIIAFITSGGKEDKTGALERLGINFGELFGKSK
jgi:hypothetical protein